MANTRSKMFLIGFNIIFFVLGAILLGLGIFALVSKPDMMNSMSRIPDEGETIDQAKNKPSLLEQGAKALCFTGGFILVLSFLGCCGAMKEIRLFLGLYAALVLIILIIEVAGATLVFIFQNKVNTMMKSFLNRTIALKYTSGLSFEDNTLKLPDDPIVLAWDTAQIALKCCGSIGPDDWKTAQNWNNSYRLPNGVGGWTTIDVEVPVSCCKVVDPAVFPKHLDQLKFVDLGTCLANSDATNTNQEGCYDALKKEISKMARILQITGLVVAIFQLIGIASSIYLCVQVGGRKKRGNRS